MTANSAASGGHVDGEKENATNLNSSRSPSKDSDDADSPPPATVLSPTPYWKVLEERGNRTSPRTTRASAKKAQNENEPSLFARGMQELDELADEDDDRKIGANINSGSSDDDSDADEQSNETFNPTMLQFSPPEKQFQMHQSARNAKRRREAELEKERVRKEKVRRAREGMMNIDNGSSSATNSLASRKLRVAKKAKRGHATTTGNFKSSGETNEDDVSAMTMTASVAPPSTEEMRQMMQQTLQENNSSRLEELVARAAAAERDVAHYKQLYQEVQHKCNGLEEEVKSKAGSESELQLRCVEQKAVIDGYEKELAKLEAQKRQLEERQTSDTDAFVAERKRLEGEIVRLKEGHAKELEDVMSRAASTKEVSDQNEERYNSVKAELETTQSKLTEYIRVNEELEAWDRENGSREELLGRVRELQSVEVDLMAQLKKEREANEAKQGTIASLQSDLEARSTAVSKKEDAIAKLEEELASVQNNLDAAKHKMESMQSPRSREAAEQGFAEELEDLESKVAALDSEKADLQGQLRKMENGNQALKNELEEVRGQKDDLTVQLDDISGHVQEAKAEAANQKAENAKLTEQIQVATSKYQDNENQLEEMAQELESTQVECQQKMREMEARKDRETGELEAKCNGIAFEKDSLEEDLSQAQKDITELGARVNTLQGELTTSQRETSDLQAQKLESDAKLTELSGQLRTLTDHLESAQSTIAALEAKLRAKAEYCEQFELIERGLLREKHVLNEIRRDLHNRVIQLSGNMRVFIRVRPLIESEHEMTLQTQQKQSARMSRLGSSSSGIRPSSRGSMAPSPSRIGRPSSRGSMVPSSRSALPSLASRGEDTGDECPFHFPSITDRNTQSSSTTSTGSSKSSPNYTSFNDLTKQTIELTEPYKDRGGLNPRRKKWKYGFDRVFHPGNSQDDVWEGAEPLVQSCVDGFQVCMFAYGQTGSGKTHTMIGDAHNRGLIPRAVEKLFAAKKEIEQSRGGARVNITVELLEIYNEEVRDLLDDNAGPDGQLIKLKLSSNEAVGNVKVNARDEQEVEGILQLAQERRCVKATKSNAESSRSHLLFTIHFDVSTTSSDGRGSSRSGCLHIVDLAGSERLDKSGSHHGTLLTEAKHINTSLSALALVVEKLQASEQHIPFRDSKLTYLLRNSLGNDSKTLAIVCCSPHQAHFNESLNSIRFAAKASKVELKESNTASF